MREGSWYFILIFMADYRCMSLVLVVMMSAVLVSGCMIKGHDEEASGLVEGSSFWRADPVSMRIYPSTRFVMESEKPLLEARIELFDAMGDSIKSSGRVRAELFAVSDSPSKTIGHRLYIWNISLQTLEDQQVYYDPITRGYIFRLKLDEFDIAMKSTLLRMTFTLPTGNRLETEDIVRVQW